MPEPEDFVKAYHTRTERAFEGLRALGRYSSSRTRRTLQILNIKELDTFIAICDVIIRKDAHYDENPR